MQYCFTEWKYAKKERVLAYVPLTSTDIKFKICMNKSALLGSIVSFFFRGIYTTHSTRPLGLLK